MWRSCNGSPEELGEVGQTAFSACGTTQSADSTYSYSAMSAGSWKATSGTDQWSQHVGDCTGHIFEIVTGGTVDIAPFNMPYRAYVDHPNVTQGECATSAIHYGIYRYSGGAWIFQGDNYGSEAGQWLVLGNGTGMLWLRQQMASDRTQSQMVTHRYMLL